MIRINLLPHDLRPIKRTPLPYALSVACVIACVIGMASFHQGQAAALATQQVRLDDTVEDLRELEPIVAEYNELSIAKARLAGRIEIIRDIIADRKIWSEHLHRLAELTPDNIWYDRIRVTTQNFREKRMVMDDRTREMVERTETIQRPVLEISGYAISDDRGEKQINPLSERTKADPAFSRDFTFIRPETEDTEFGGFSVRRFTFTYVVENRSSDSTFEETGPTAAEVE